MEERPSVARALRNRLGSLGISTAEVVTRLMFLAGGFVTILGIVGHVSGAIPLHLWGPFVVFPVAVLLVAVGVIFPKVGKIALCGWLAGLLAVLLYDCSRMPFVFAGIMHDFIPGIGDWLLQREGVHPIVGYAWRFAGNGGGMGVSYAIILSFLHPRGRAAFWGVVYGLWIFCNLLATLLFVPDATTFLFPITAVNFGIGLLGHVVYGVVLGLACKPVLRLSAGSDD